MKPRASRALCLTLALLVFASVGRALSTLREVTPTNLSVDGFMFEITTKEMADEVAFHVMIAANADDMWPGADEEAQRIGHMARVLGASCDPRAAVVLGRGYEMKDRDGQSVFPAAIRLGRILFEYFVRDYDALPAATTNGNEIFPLVDRWWQENKTLLLAEIEPRRR